MGVGEVAGVADTPRWRGRLNRAHPGLAVGAERGSRLATTQEAVFDLPAGWSYLRDPPRQRAIHADQAPRLKVLLARAREPRLSGFEGAARGRDNRTQALGLLRRVYLAHVAVAGIAVLPVVALVERQHLLGRIGQEQIERRQPRRQRDRFFEVVPRAGDAPSDAQALRSHEAPPPGELHPLGGRQRTRGLGARLLLGV